MKKEELLQLIKDEEKPLQSTKCKITQITLNINNKKHTIHGNQKIKQQIKQYPDNTEFTEIWYISHQVPL